MIEVSEVVPQDGGEGVEKFVSIIGAQWAAQKVVVIILFFCSRTNIWARELGQGGIYANLNQKRLVWFSYLGCCLILIKMIDRAWVFSGPIRSDRLFLKSLWLAWADIQSAGCSSPSLC